MSTQPAHLHLSLTTDSYLQGIPVFIDLEAKRDSDFTKACSNSMFSSSYVHFQVT